MLHCTASPRVDRLPCKVGFSLALAAKGYLAQLREAEAAEGSGSEDEATRDAVGQRLRSDALEVSTLDTCCELRAAQSKSHWSLAAA